MNTDPTPSGAVHPRLIGIAGPTCSGKSTLAHALAAALAPAGGALTLEMDCYYRDLSHLEVEERAKTNFDCPEALDAALFVEHLRTLLHGQPVLCPSYNFATHSRETCSHRLEPQPFIIVEGLLALFWEEARGVMDLRVFVDLPVAECLARRLQRDVSERGRSKQSVLHQFNETVQPMYIEFCKPTAKYADLVLEGSDPVDVMVSSVLAWLGDARKKRAGAARAVK